MSFFVGTLHYIAPEMILNEKHVTCSVDVYAFGVVLWEMFARSYPYRGTPLKFVIESMKVS